MSHRIFGSVCSGIEAASVAWGPLGWEAEFFAEIDPFPCAVLAHHYPGVPNLGDFTTIRRSARPINLLVGGTPCQSFSVAGLRGGMDDARGVLALEFLRLADRLGPEWLVWENVPGVLSSWSDDPDCPPRDVDGDRQGGQAQVVQQRHDFGCFLAALAELGYGWAYRVLDAQYLGVPQRRRRVFVVGRLGDWRGPAAVLFERHSLSGNPPPRQEARKGTTEGLARSLRGRSNLAHREDADTLIARTLTAHPSGRFDGDTETFVPEVAFGLQSQAGRFENGSRIGNAWNTNYVAHTLRGEGFDASEDGTGRGTPLVPVAFNPQAGGKQTSLGYEPGSQTTGTLSVCQTPAIAGAAVRRLTPLECERLQGFPDRYTAVPYRGKPATDGPRYKALGNSMAVPVMAWIGRRIDLVSKIMETTPCL